MEILRRRAAFDADLARFLTAWASEQKELSERIIRAKNSLNNIKVSDDTLEKIVEITSSLNLDGHRADIVMMRAVRALSAFEGKDAVEIEDIKHVAQFSLSHRVKRLPFEEIGREGEKLSAILFPCGEG